MSHGNLERANTEASQRPTILWKHRGYLLSLISSSSTSRLSTVESVAHSASLSLALCDSQVLQMSTLFSHVPGSHIFKRIRSLSCILISGCHITTKKAAGQPTACPHLELHSATIRLGQSRMVK